MTETRTAKVVNPETGAVVFSHVEIVEVVCGTVKVRGSQMTGTYPASWIVAK